MKVPGASPSTSLLSILRLSLPLRRKLYCPLPSLVTTRLTSFGATGASGDILNYSINNVKLLSSDAVLPYYFTHYE